MTDQSRDPRAAAVKPAKPLRMKVPKSKERALRREFGLDGAALSADEAHLRRSEFKALVTLGKNTFHAAGSQRSPARKADRRRGRGREDVDDMGIAVYEQHPCCHAADRGRTGAATTDDETEEGAEAAQSTVDAEFGRSTDPVRMYMPWPV
jgi:RNA polymerase primary sigma factor